MSAWKNMTRLVSAAAFGGLTMGGAMAQDVVNIGFTGPLSGGAALYGKNTLVGLEMAAKEINDAGGIEVGGKKYKINLVALDDKYAPSESAVVSPASASFSPVSGSIWVSRSRVRSGTGGGATGRGCSSTWLSWVVTSSRRLARRLWKSS